MILSVYHPRLLLVTIPSTRAVLAQRTPPLASLILRIVQTGCSGTSTANLNGRSRSVRSGALRRNVDTMAIGRAQEKYKRRRDEELGCDPGCCLQAS
ncbi:uncharacterized protein EDB93DRAFT_360928 [Suillus bovinus]|uniref:uncharacterized protein n=1 Tax=Suillus bovinus TaxID=48563 RepID=UPI001B881573|nr:uncharacterized protein EDB93DRAFT_360928 [Suillus bovinus]KAG2149107.1 hypothetical protein EDB93DRAFT_360928 [Suillus bovinus]